MPKILEKRTGIGETIVMAEAKPEAGTYGAWDRDGERYCIDCINEIVQDPEERELLFNNPENHPAGGPVRTSNESTIQYHCGMNEECVNSTTDHEYGHNEPVGQPIHTTVLDYAEEPTMEDPVIHVENSEEFIFTVMSGNFKYKVEYEVDADNLVLIERTNRGTRETERHRDMPEGMEEYAREIVEEGKQAGAPWA